MTKERAYQLMVMAKFLEALQHAIGWIAVMSKEELETHLVRSDLAPHDQDNVRNLWEEFHE